MHPAKLLILAGVILVVVGSVWYFAGPGPLSRLGRLPGDIHIRRENWSFHFPLMTSILLSLVLTLLLYLFRR